MAFPLLPVAAGAAALLLFGRKKGAAAGPASPSSPGAVPSPVNPLTGQQVPIAERMAVVLASGNPAAIRFEAGRLRQEGYPGPATELEREAAKLEKQAAAQQQQAGAAAVHAAAPPAPVKPPAVQQVPPGAIVSPGVPQHPAYMPQPAAVPPIVVQTPQGPIQVPGLQMPVQTQPVVVQTPTGPIQVSVPVPQLPQIPVMPQPAAGVPPIAVPGLALVPLPPLAKGEVLDATSPGQTTSEKTRILQNKLLSIGLLTPADVIGKYGPKTTAAVKNFQLLANAYLKAIGKPVFLPTAGVTVQAIKVDGRWGNQSNDMAALAHPPKGAGSGAAIFGYDSGMAPSEPQPASPMPGVIPEMAPAPIDPGLALAARVAANLSSTADGQEDRNLVQLFQASRNMKPSGFYGPEVAWGLAQLGFVPPRPRYWPRSGTSKAKRNYKRALLQQAERDPQRVEEWKQAAAQV